MPEGNVAWDRNYGPGVRSRRAELLEQAGLQAAADYDRQAIKMGVSSWIEYSIRLHSCKKEPETIAWIEGELSEASVLYDVGANVGAYTLVAAAYGGRAVRVRTSGARDARADRPSARGRSRLGGAAR